MRYLLHLSSAFHQFTEGKRMAEGVGYVDVTQHLEYRCAPDAGRGLAQPRRRRKLFDTNDDRVAL